MLRGSVIMCTAAFVGVVVHSMAQHPAAKDKFENKTNVMTARCRAQCLSKFYVDDEKQDCFESSNCWMCWDTCNLIYNNFKVWGAICEEKQTCFPGCQEACSFYDSRSDIIEATRTDTRFRKPFRYTYTPEEDSVRLEWSRPEGNDSIDPLVYVLAVMDMLTLRRWQPLEQTIYHNVTIRRDLLKWSSFLQLTAYDANGRIARMQKDCSEFDFNSDVPEARETLHRDQASLANEAYHPSTDASMDYVDNYYRKWTPTLRSLHYSTRNIGGVDAVITWDQLFDKREVKYEVEWQHADESMDVTGHLYTHNNAITITMWPNSVYRVVVRAFVSGSRRPVVESRFLEVDTAAHVSGFHPLIDYCSGCVPVQHLAGLAVGVATLAFVIAVVLVFIKLCHRERPAEGEIPRTHLTFPNQCATKPLSSFKRTSVKKQLSASVETLIPHGPLNSSGRPLSKDARLIQEEPALTSEHHTPNNHRYGNVCNI